MGVNSHYYVLEDKMHIEFFFSFWLYITAPFFQLFQVLTLIVKKIDKKGKSVLVMSYIFFNKFNTAIQDQLDGV